MKKITFLFMTVASVLFVACSPKTPSNTVKEFLNYIKAEKYEKAVEYFFLEDETASKEDLEVFAAKLKEGYAKDGKHTIAKFEILKEEINEDKASVEVKVFYTDDTDDTEMYQLQKNKKGEWKILIDSK
jgi:hypothetical protein